jgi:hypothetical protein
MKKLLKILIYVIYLLTILSFGLYLSTNYIRNVFGKFTLQQILFNIRTTNSNIDIVSHYAFLAIPYAVVFFYCGGDIVIFNCKIIRI